MKLVSLLVLTHGFAFAQSSISDVQIERTSEDGYTGVSVSASASRKADGLVALLRESEDASDPRDFATIDVSDQPEALVMGQQQQVENLQGRERRVQAPQQTRRVTQVNAGATRSLDDIDRVFSRSSGSGFVLRCWQEGRLILQRNVARMPRLEREVVELDAADGVQLQLFDLQNAMCMVQKRQ
jgi:hypothetical protein